MKARGIAIIDLEIDGGFKEAAAEEVALNFILLRSTDPGSPLLSLSST